MRVVFLGTGAFAVASLEALVASEHQVVALVTQPDRRKGRGRVLASPATKALAEAHAIPVLQPERVRTPEAQDALRRFAPEVQVVVAFGQILPRAVIDIAPRGTVNVHASLLPRLRGAAPIQWAIAGGETQTGVTTMLIDEGLDTGPMLLWRAAPIGPEETAADLEPRLARLGAELLLDTLQGLGDGSVTPVPQDHARATKAPILTKEDGRIDWQRPARELHARIRGFFPWPGCFTLAPDGRTLKVLKARLADDAPPARDAVPGEVLVAGSEGLVVQCAGGSRLRLIEVQPESRRPMSAAAFAAGARLSPGTRLG